MQAHHYCLLENGAKTGLDTEMHILDNKTGMITDACIANQYMV